MGKSQRDKGARGEHELVRLLPGAVKISRTGYSTHDIDWLDRTVEVKRRANGFKTLYRWLQDAQIVAHRADRQPWLITMNLDTLLDLLDETRQP